MMEMSLEELNFKVENLTTAVNSAIALDLLQRKSADIERSEILNELKELKQSIRTMGLGTVAQQAERLGLATVEPNRLRGRYIGVVVGLDYRAYLVKHANGRGFEVPFNVLAEGSERPRRGDSVRIGFNEGVMSLSVAERISRKPNSEKS